MSPEKHYATQAMHSAHVVDNSDWLKAFAIILVVIGHTGYFFIEDAQWWSVFGRMAAPAFFFLMGYARSRTIPFRWVWLGVILTLLDSWNTDWEWVAPNILLGMVLIRVSRPFVKSWLQRYGWVAFAVLVAILWRRCQSQRRWSITVPRDGYGPCSDYVNACMSTNVRFPTWAIQTRFRQHPRKW